MTTELVYIVIFHEIGNTNKLLGKDITVDNAELPENFECEYLEGTPKYFAARRVAAENK